MHPFVVFRSADPSAPIRRLAGDEWFHCEVCGGKAIVEEVERFSTYEELVDEAPASPRRGRRPAPLRSAQDSGLVDLGLAG